MTFTIPEDLALRRVPARDRSRYITEALTAKLREREERMIRACEFVKRNAYVVKIERDWDALSDKTDRIEEPWHRAGQVS